MKNIFTQPLIFKFYCLILRSHSNMLVFIQVHYVYNSYKKKKKKKKKLNETIIRFTSYQN